jgi:hypothetical protein
MRASCSGVVNASKISVKLQIFSSRIAKPHKEKQRAVNEFFVVIGGGRGENTLSSEIRLMKQRD